MNDELTREEIVVMAMAAIAEETGIDAKDLVVKNFREVKKSGLYTYIEDNKINYKKYQLGD